MAKVQKTLYLEVPAWKAQPSPPLGPMLWANWVNIGQFIKEFNDKTQDVMQKFAWYDMKVRCVLTVFADRTFKLEIWGLVTSNLILRKTQQKKWSWEPNKNKIAKLSRTDLEEIAEFKKWDLNTDNLEAIIATLAWTAKNMWISIENWAVKSKEERLALAA